MDTTTLEIIKKLSQQVNVDAIETKDLVKELESLYTKVQILENELERQKNINISQGEVAAKHFSLLENYKKEYVIPAVELTEMKEKFEREKFEFDIEKKYIKLDRTNMLEIVRMLTSRFASNSSEYNTNGCIAHQESHNWEKPNLQ